MSGGEACRCPERSEPITTPAGSNRPGRLWRVGDRKQNHSAFNGYHATPSAYSSVRCLRCGKWWRTKAPYVDQLPDLHVESEINISPGTRGYADAMEARGRPPEAPPRHLPEHVRERS